MKKIISLILILISLLSLAACSDSEFPPVESTEEESRVLMTVRYEKEEYEIRYELYRALFLNFKTEYDGGDSSFWSRPESAEAKEKINGTIVNFCKDIFAVLHLAKSIGFDPYSNEADKLVMEYISDSVNGNADTAEGFGGDYDKYLASLREMNLNYSVQTLLYRYSIAYNKIIEYYAGSMDAEEPMPGAQEGKLNYTKDDVKAFYESNECVRATLIEINSLYISRQRAEEIREKIDSFTDEESVLNYAVSYTAGDADDILNGVLIGTHSMDSAYYAEVRDEAFSLGLYETSKVIDVSTGQRTDYWILFIRGKSDEHFENNYSDIVSVYKSQMIGKMLYEITSKMTDIEKSANFDSIDLSQVSM